jgi:hypothetical protein
MTHSEAPPTDEPRAGPGDRPPARPVGPTPDDRLPEGPSAAGRMASEDGDADPDAPGPAMRAVAYGLVAAVLTGFLLWVFAAILAFSAGLLVVAFFLGRIVGLSVRTGAGDGLSSAARTSVSILWSIGAITAAMVATWLFAGLSGGVLGLGEYLVETLGPIVPLQYMIATVAAWWTSR